MTYYLVTDLELQKLSDGQLAYEEVAKPENIACFTWAGDDIKDILESKLGYSSPELIEQIVDYLLNSDIGNDIDFTVELIISEIKDKLRDREYEQEDLILETALEEKRGI